MFFELPVLPVLLVNPNPDLACGVGVSELGMACQHAGMNVVARVRERALEYGDLAAIIEANRTTTYRELYDRVDRLSAAVHALGLRKGDSLLALLGNEREAIECELAALQSGLAWVTLNARLTWAEIRGVVVTCAPRVVVCNEAGFRTVREGLKRHGLDHVPLVIATGPGHTKGNGSVREPLSYERLLEAHPPRRPDVSTGPADVARLRYTSGTTGSAKAAVLPHRVYEAGLDNLIAELPPLSREDRTLHVAPLTHGAGALVYPMLWAGGQNVLMTHFEADDVLSAIERHRITTMFTVPTILSRLIAAPSFGERDLSSLKSLIYGGAPMPEAQLTAAVEKIGHALLHIYGMTEAPWPITTLKQEEHRIGNPHLRCIGKPTTLCELRIVDEAGNVLGDGEVGEIQIRGKNVMTGYYQDEEATRAVLKNGWLSSGDLGVRDREGYYAIVDRKKDVIISGGFNVYAKEVEMALCEHPGILEVAVVGLPHADFGELVAAWVVPRPSVSLQAEDVDRFARSRLSGYKCPRRIEVVGELPKNASGKIQKREIVERLSAS